MDKRLFRLPSLNQQNRWAGMLALGFMMPLAVTATAQPSSTSTSYWETTPEWIWGPGPRDELRPVVLRTSVDLPDGVRQARVEWMTDFSDVELTINGQSVGRLEPFCAVAEWDVMPWVRPGSNDWALVGKGTGGPAAVALRLTWHDRENQPHVVQTSSQWRSESGMAEAFGHVGRVLWEGNRGPVPLNPSEDYTQWKRALNPGQVTQPSTFVVPPGFEIELLRVAGPEEGSWVAMAFDDQERLTVAQEKQGLLRFTMDASRQAITRVETIDETLQECRGLLYRDGDLYANANNSKALYRLRDTTDDGRFDQRETLYAPEGGVGHGRNDLAFGPGDELHVIHGDSVELPRGFADRTSPAREHRRGANTSEGHLLRISGNGPTGVVVAAGMRNPFGVAFNRDGEAFTYDADAEHDMGAPWYRPTRVYHLVAGSDFGWRGVTGSWPPYYPDHADNAPTALDIGRGSPTAVKFARGERFPPPYDDALFILDWAYGRVMTVQMEPRGASYGCLGETFLQGRPLNVTDLEFGADGAMYLITGGRATQSALYRVRYRGPAVSKPVATPQQHARREQAQHARTQRRSLEQHLQPTGPDALDEAWLALADADPWIRYVARTVVEHQPLERWTERALQEQDRPRAVMALMALVRCDASRYGTEIARRLAELPLESLAPREQTAALYAAWLCLESHPDEPGVRAALATWLGGHYPSRAPGQEERRQWNLWASRILVAAAPQRAVPATMQLLLQTDDQHQQLHYLFVLRTAREGWTERMRQLYFSRLRDAQHFQSGAGMPEFLKRIRDDATAALSEHERAQLGPWLKAEPAEPLPAGKPRPTLHRWTMGELAELVSAAAQKDRTADPEVGERLFVEAQCAACHRLATHGRPFGPDLTYAAGRYSPQDLLRAIALPSEVVAEEYRNVQVVTDDGKVHVGRVLASGDFRQATLRLASDLAHPERVTEIQKNTIVEYRPSPLSPMPEGLLDVLTADEVLELLSYIRSGGMGP